VLNVAFGPAQATQAAQAAQATTAVAAGQVPIASTSLPPALPLLRGGQVRAIAVVSPVRHPGLPDVPTVAEQGFPGFQATTWVALLAPLRATPADALPRLAEAVGGALASAEMQARLGALGMAAPGRAGDPADAFIGREAALWAAVVRDSGATVE